MHRCRWVGALGRSPSARVRRDGRGHGSCCVVRGEGRVQRASEGAWAGLV